MDHSHILRRIVEAKDKEDADKLPQEVTLYWTPEMIDKSGTDPETGARCGKCAFFNAAKSECLITDPPACNAEHGVCGLFVGGKPVVKDEMVPQQLVPKTAAGYIEDEKNVPTHCGNCEYFIKGENRCKNVAGEVHEFGCCNGWEEV